MIAAMSSQSWKVPDCQWKNLKPWIVASVRRDHHHDDQLGLQGSLNEPDEDVVIHESTPQPTSYSDTVTEGQVPVPQTIVRLPADILYRIFTLLHPTSYQPPIDGEYDSELKFLACTAPYNNARVCRSWRSIVPPPSPSLWSSFFLRFSNPSYLTPKLLKTSIERYLTRSRTLPLTCFVRLDGRYNKSLSKKK